MRTATRLAVMGAAVLAVLELRGAQEATPVARWSFEQVRAATVTDAVGQHVGTVKGTLEQAAGVDGQAFKFDGGLVSVPPVPSVQFADATFSVAAWVNPYVLDSSQQMIVAKNVYSASQREWGLMLDQDNRFRFYLWQRGWKTLAAPTEPRPGHWHHVAVTVEKGHARLYINGRQEAEGTLASSVPATDAPLTIGGVQDGERVVQAFQGALDEVSLYRGVLTPAAIRAAADKPTTPHKIEAVEPVTLWSGGAMPKAAAIPVLKGTEFHVIKPYEFDKDGYRFLHGVALAWHKGRLYASFGHNRGGENTDTEEARVRHSDDGGKTWSPVTTIDAGDEPGVGVSHGVWLSLAGRLWAFHGAYTGTMQDVHTRCYVLDEAAGKWERKGTVIEGGFWPLGEPQRMENGHWIMAGIRVGKGNPAAVAISHGDDVTKWDLVVIPQADGLGNVWGESAVIVAGKRITNIARYGRKPLALVAISDDFGRTWTPSRPANLPMATSKPCAGTLSTGQRYLICTTTADSGGRRAPLTIAVSRPGEPLFSKVFVIRHAAFPEGPGESHERAALAYPCAIEHEGRLYVGYSNSGGGVGRKGTGRELWNNNSGELAIIPLEKLRIEP